MNEVVKQLKMHGLCNDSYLRIELAVRILAGYDENLTTGALSTMWLSGCCGMDADALSDIIEQGLTKVELQCQLLRELYS
jgi:hypothetical protein